MLQSKQSIGVLLLVDMKKYCWKIAILVICLLTLVNLCLVLTSCQSSDDTNVICTIDIDSYNIVLWESDIVVYTTDKARQTYGYEIAVNKDSDVVTKIGETVQADDNEYVVCANGDAVDVLKLVRVGDFAEISFFTLTIRRYDYVSALKMVEIENYQVDDFVEYKIENLYDVDVASIQDTDQQIDVALQNLQNQADEKQISAQQFEENVQDVLNLVEQKRWYATESNAVEGRGMWHRPNATFVDESTIDGVKQFVAEVVKLNVNTIYLETFWNGKTTYFSEYLQSGHRISKNDYDGKDYVTALIDECHANGIEVHAWFEVLNAGVSGWNPPSYIKDEWICTDNNGNNSANFLDPTNDEVKSFLQDVLAELLQHYDFDGISYDYIRYQETADGDDYLETGFTDNAIAQFCEQYGYGSKNLQCDMQSNEQMRADWKQFKTDSITNLVQDLTLLIRKQKPQTIVSASPYGYVDGAKYYYAQDIETWIQNGYVDVVLPMLYTESANLLQTSALPYCNYSSNVLTYVGIAPMYTQTDFNVQYNLMETLHDINLHGISFFASQNYLTKNTQYTSYVQNTLTTSFYRQKAVSPTASADLVFDAWKTQLLDRCERLYYAKLNQQEIAVIKDFANQTNFNLDENGIQKLLNKLQELENRVNSFEYQQATDRIVEQIDYLTSVLKANLRRISLRKG